MTVAPQLAVGTTLQAIDDTSYSIFQNLNAPGATTLIAGNIFLGLQGYCAVAFPLGKQLGLARGGTIENSLISCAVTFRAAAAWAAGGQLQVNCMLDDSPRAGPLDARLAWKPPGGFGPAWRRDFWGLFDQRLENTVGTPFFDSAPSVSVNWAILQTAGAREQLAAPFTVPAGPSWSVARAIVRLMKTGAPAGSLEVAIQGDTTDGYGHNQPDGVDLGVSAVVANAGIPAGPSDITFAFAPDVVLPPGRYWTVLRPSTPWVVDGANFVSWQQGRAFLADGGSHFSSNSVRFSLGNYPGHIDVFNDTNPKVVGPNILWNVPAKSAGQSVSTPDLTSLVQEVILTSGHETASAICFTFTAVGQTITYRFAAHGHPTLAAPGFAAQYRRRDHRGGL